MLTNNEIKKKLGEYAAGLVEQDMLIGLGTGSTVYWLIQELGKRVQEGLHITIVPTSSRTKLLASELGIHVAELNDVDTAVFTIDGADEVDSQFQLIKGGGGALLREKMVAAASQQLIIIVDQGKMVEHLGKFPLPAEVIPFGWNQVRRRIQQLGCKEIILRQNDGKPFITDQGNYILDCHFQHINDPAALNTALHLIPGIVETGLFIDMAATIITGYEDGKIEVRRK